MNKKNSLQDTISVTLGFGCCAFGGNSPHNKNGNAEYVIKYYVRTLKYKLWLFKELIGALVTLLANNFREAYHQLILMGLSQVCSYSENDSAVNNSTLHFQFKIIDERSYHPQIEIPHQ